MTAPRLKTLIIRNFRSLCGDVVVPLDAQVVLVHGTNGMGKTSVLSALELALTGKIAHLATDGDGYRSYLTTLQTGGGSIELTTTAPYREGAHLSGSLDFSDTSFVPKPLLDAADARFFAERCYLPQATLTVLASQMAGAAQRLKQMTSIAEKGQGLTASARETRWRQRGVWMRCRRRSFPRFSSSSNR